MQRGRGHETGRHTEREHASAQSKSGVGFLKHFWHVKIAAYHVDDRVRGHHYYRCSKPEMYCSMLVNLQAWQDPGRWLCFGTGGLLEATHLYDGLAP